LKIPVWGCNAAHETNINIDFWREESRDLFQSEAIYYSVDIMFVVKDADPIDDGALLIWDQLDKEWY